MSPSLWMINFANFGSEENSINVITQLNNKVISLPVCIRIKIAKVRLAQHKISPSVSLYQNY